MLWVEYGCTSASVRTGHGSHNIPSLYDATFACERMRDDTPHLAIVTCSAAVCVVFSVHEACRGCSSVLACSGGCERIEDDGRCSSAYRSHPPKIVQPATSAGGAIGTSLVTEVSDILATGNNM